MNWAITDQFHEYPYGKTFDVYTDNNPLAYVLTTAKWDALGHRWITCLANYNFHIHYKSRKSNLEAAALSWIDWEKCDETIQADSIQSIVAAAIAGNVANHIKAVSCSPQTLDSLFPCILDTPIVNKAITRSSRQGHSTCLEPESSILKITSNLDDSSCPEVDTGHPLNPKCMTVSDWIEAQPKDKTIGKII